MITDILLLTSVLIAIAAVGMFISAVARAPEGMEDESGFHYRKSGSPVSRPPFIAKPVRFRAKKNAGLHMPAA